jgi:transglutaminase-like putative cysteine protease
VYRYAKPIERSLHVLRLTPVHDRLQNVLSHELAVSVPAQEREYEDVFGNRVRRLSVESPFTELVIEAKSTVAVLDVDPIGVGPLRVSQTIPLVWMPWQRQVLDPFLLPPELPETELAELAEYAMSFVKRNDYDLLDTLLDINATMHAEYAYIQGSTTVYTTPFEVYVNRRGVCQDFTNLMICLARLLGVPARYVCGYIYTGPKNTNQVQSEASHAWVQVYLPQLGWKGFDPTNGVLTQTDHVRVAVGRNYLDATPTSGTIFVGGGGETLAVDVQVTPR